MMDTPRDHNDEMQLPCTCGGNDCSSNASVLGRRDFLKTMGAVSAGVSLTGMVGEIMAGPFDEKDVALHPIPLDKKLHPGWLRALGAKGEPPVYQGWENLKYIGMPCGGVGAGMVYLGGDGKLWLWEIFNQKHEGVVDQTVANFKGQRVRPRDGSNYINPPEQFSPLHQNFYLRVTSLDGEIIERELSHKSFPNVSFQGQYPIGIVRYSESELPVEVTLEAYTPFIPLNTDDSSLPATILDYTLTNTGKKEVQVELEGTLENVVCCHSRERIHAMLKNRMVRGRKHTGLKCSIEKIPEGTEIRPDIVFEDFEADRWQGWTVEGKAFGDGPFPRSLQAPQQSISGHRGDRLVNTHDTRQTGGNGPAADRLTGKLISAPFTVSRKYVVAGIAGGHHPGKVELRVVVEGNIVGTVTGDNSNRLKSQSINVSQHEGKQAHIELIDAHDGANQWGILLVDQIVFSDRIDDHRSLEERLDFGTMTLAALQTGESVRVLPMTKDVSVKQQGSSAQVTTQDNISLVGSVAQKQTLQPGESCRISFVIAWHFPNTESLPGIGHTRRWYAEKFADANAVVRYLADQYERLAAQTRLWRDTWYDSTLPWWLLDRTFANTSILATNTCYRLADGRFWGWEGIGCCPGTCTHVWHYAQAVGRVFPELEQDLRRRTDYDTAFRERDGYIDFRGGVARRDATDGQAGVILRTLREHQMSGSETFLKPLWPRVKKALEFLIAQDARDGEPDGIPVGEQHNTLDAEWYGKIPVLASLYLAALRAGEKMALDMEDSAFAHRCNTIYAQGKKNILALFDAKRGFFIQEEDPSHRDAIGIGPGCYIDQAMGQWWAFQVGMGRLYDGDKIRRALTSLWDYNFCPDMGALRATLETGVRGRPYAIAGDAGLVICTWPKGGKRDDWEKHWQFGYFNECMTGFEYQAAGHMIWESAWQSDLLEKGLAITRAIHDRYHPSLRNPYNEIECSDHYARAMSSYGVFQALCGYTYHGPNNRIGFAPRFSPERFKAPFTAAEGWGTFEQTQEQNGMEGDLAVKWGHLLLKEVTLAMTEGFIARHVLVNGSEATFVQSGDTVTISFSERVRLESGQSLKFEVRV